MNLEKISSLQDTLDELQESIYDIKELLLDKNPLTHEAVTSFVKSGAVMIAKLSKAITIKSPLDDLRQKEEQIFQMICDASGYTKDEVLNGAESRKRELLEPRQVHQAILQSTFGYSDVEASKIYQQHRCTARSSLERVNEHLFGNKKFKETYGHIFLICQNFNPETEKLLNIKYLTPIL